MSKCQLNWAMAMAKTASCKSNEVRVISTALIDTQESLSLSRCFA